MTWRSLYRERPLSTVHRASCLRHCVSVSTPRWRRGITGSQRRWPDQHLSRQWLPVRPSRLLHRVRQHGRTVRHRRVDGAGVCRQRLDGIRRTSVQAVRLGGEPGPWHRRRARTEGLRQIYYRHRPVVGTTAAAQRRYSSHSSQTSTALCCCIVNSLTPTVAIWISPAIKHPVPDRVKPSFVIFDTQALWRSGECPGVKNYKWRLNPVWVWHKMLFSCTHMATVGVRGLIITKLNISLNIQQ